MNTEPIAPAPYAWQRGLPPVPAPYAWLKGAKPVPAYGWNGGVVPVDVATTEGKSASDSGS